MNIENKKQLATILLAVGLGIVAVVLTGQYIKTSIDSQSKKSREYADKQIQKSQQKNQALLKELSLLKKQVQKVSDDQKKQVVIRPKKGKAEGPVGAFSLNTPTGKRAMTIMVDSLNAVGGLVSPGDFVDIFAKIEIPTTSKKKSDKETITTVLFQDIQVLAVGINYRPAGSKEIYASQQKARSLRITLALSPEEVGLLEFAQSKGKLKLSLRSPGEREAEVLQVASWDALADYVLEQQGTELMVPQKRAVIQMEDGKKSVVSDEDDEVKPFIQIFKGGRPVK